MQKRILTSVALSLVLTACGGGGGGGSTSPTGGGSAVQPPKSSSSSAASQDSVSISLEKSEVSIPESSSVEVAINIGSNDGVTYTVDSPDPALSGTVNGRILQINSANVDFPKNAVITVTAKKGSASDSAKISVHIDNSSAKNLIEKVSTLITQKETLGKLTEEKTVFEFVNELAFKSSYATRSEMKASAAAFEAIALNASNEISDAINKVSLSLDGYNKGETGESQLKSDYDAAISVLNKNGKLAMVKINEAINLSKGPFTIVGAEYNFSSMTGNHSQFFGNAAIGYMDGTQWKFNKSHDYLNDLLNSTSCPAQ